ncbi:SPOR domain-containing protein [Polynucleobacter sp. JS-Safj-400b-B2]|uniref:SPOR domain-containing protein n=1 Tax=Polynucleobacter sp. JS-Safj-400b-B2 TaxID=2576921 RepID=UPI001C0DE501|nr:SPOR domain-containing protein [Polynucleobacter sp. JS-Safj-400b-B2]MBU3626983.1 SPOR domain-containing protein [Polynucleobacter sp. JS-Safj-400b-B2]
MIRLPSFFKRKTQSDDLELGPRGSRTAKRAAPRSFQRAAEAEELALTEDPEQQRARHRLIGAAVLVLIAVVGLPRILDSKPKMSPNDIAVNIVTSLPIPGTEINPEEKTKAETSVEPAKETPKAAVAPNPETKAEPKPEVKPTPPATNKSATLGLAAGEEVVAASASKPEPKPKSDDVTKPATSNGSGKYVIQIGAFASEANVKALSAKLKNQNIPSYTLNKTGADGGKIFLVRAGPFTDKDVAEAAEKKIKAMGLTPRLVESGKQ